MEEEVEEEVDVEVEEEGEGEVEELEAVMDLQRDRPARLADVKGGIKFPPATDHRTPRPLKCHICPCSVRLTPYTFHLPPYFLHLTPFRWDILQSNVTSHI